VPNALIVHLTAKNRQATLVFKSGHGSAIMISCGLWVFSASVTLMMQVLLKMPGYIIGAQSNRKATNCMRKRDNVRKNAHWNRKIDVRPSVDLKLQIVLVLICVLIAKAGTNMQMEQTHNENIPVPQLKELAIHIKAAEKKLHNIKVCSELCVDQSDDPNNPLGVWLQTPIYVNSTMWSDGQPEGKIRVDVHKQILKWVKDEKTVSYSERSFSASFDGTTARTIIKKSGELGKAVSVRDGVVTSPERPRYFDDIWCRQYTGRYFTMRFFKFNEQGTSFSDLFNLAEDSNSLVTTYLDFNWEKLSGIECIKISFKKSINQNWSKRWWLDPARGFAILRYENVRTLEDKTETYRSLMEIQELKEVTKGVWWPIKATSVNEPLRPGEPYMRMRYHASEVLANNSNIDENIYAQID
jgi:hypothetical protein